MEVAAFEKKMVCIGQIVFLTNRKDYLHSDTRKNLVLSEVEGKEELHQLRWEYRSRLPYTKLKFRCFYKKLVVFLTNRKDYFHLDTRKNKDGCILLNDSTEKFIRTLVPSASSGQALSEVEGLWSCPCFCLQQKTRGQRLLNFTLCILILLSRKHHATGRHCERSEAISQEAFAFLRQSRKGLPRPFGPRNDISSRFLQSKFKFQMFKRTLMCHPESPFLLSQENTGTKDLSSDSLSRKARRPLKAPLFLLHRR